MSMVASAHPSGDITVKYISSVICHHFCIQPMAPRAQYRRYTWKDRSPKASVVLLFRLPKPRQPVEQGACMTSRRLGPPDRLLRQALPSAIPAMISLTSKRPFAQYCLTNHRAVSQQYPLISDRQSQGGNLLIYRLVGEQRCIHRVCLCPVSSLPHQRPRR